MAFNSDLDHVPYWEKIFGKYNWNVTKGAEVGKANGLSMLLDAETFDYTFHLKAGEGFKIAVHHHLDQPIMSIKELDISPGSVFQVCCTWYSSGKAILHCQKLGILVRFNPFKCGRFSEIKIKGL